MNQLAVAEQGFLSTSLLMNSTAMDQIYRFAEFIASGKTTVPVHFRNNPADCMAVTMQAVQWGMLPLSVMQKTHVINGVMGYEAQLVSAVINSSGLITERFRFEWFGPWENIVGKFTVKQGDKGEYRVPGWKLADETGCGVRVWATIAGESEARVLDLLLAQARTRNSGLWADDPKQQLAYLAQKKWARLHAPDVIMGVYTPDELEEIPRAEVELNPVQQEKPAASAAAALSAAKKTKPAAPVNFDDELEQVALPPEAQKLLSLLEDCQNIDDLNGWGSAASAQFPLGTPTGDELAAAYQAKYNYFSQNQ